jgi:hypothetical protein
MSVFPCCFEATYCLHLERFTGARRMPNSTALKTYSLHCTETTGNTNPPKWCHIPEDNSKYVSEEFLLHYRDNKEFTFSYDLEKWEHSARETQWESLYTHKFS